LKNGTINTTPMSVIHKTSGVRWVERYLFPLIDTHLAVRSDAGLICLQIEPDDEEEAIRLRAEDYLCDTVVYRKSPASNQPWQQSPILADPLQLPLESHRYDLIFSGAFSRIAPSPERRCGIAREMARVCRPGGAVLLTLGNRWCPIDLTRRPPVLHQPWSHDMVSLTEMERLFVGECGFSRLRLLSLAEHFGWSSLSGIKKLLAPWLERYLLWSAMPDRRWRYASPLNPIFSLWFER
jgi:SAM-dependent methyltransferase